MPVLFLDFRHVSFSLVQTAFYCILCRGIIPAFFIIGNGGRSVAKDFFYYAAVVKCKIGIDSFHTAAFFFCRIFKFGHGFVKQGIVHENQSAEKEIIRKT